jgi:hypothetical protein
MQGRGLMIARCQRGTHAGIHPSAQQHDGTASLVLVRCHHGSAKPGICFLMILCQLQGALAIRSFELKGL